MKKIFALPLLLGAMLSSCDNDEIVNGTYENKLPVNMKASEVFAYSGGNQIGSTRAWSKTEENGYSIPVDGKYDVWYFIRIDGNIPGEDVTNLPSNQYFPQTATGGKTLVSDLNHGQVLANAAWHESTAKKFPKYIYSTDGSAVQSIITEEPTLEDLIEANQSTTYNLQGYLDHKDELHFIWYACKQQSTDHIWHIDGILTSNDRTDIAQTQYGPAQIADYENNGIKEDKGSVVTNVEVDIHQQEHKDWNEIKTSIHLRDNVEVEVFLPIDYAEQADDFDIRIGKDYAYITEYKNISVQIDDKSYTFNVNIKHEAAGIRITVFPNREALEAAKKKYGDGITFEVHNYVVPQVTSEAIWAKLKTSTVTTKTYTCLTGQITSAYYPEERIELPR